MINSTRAIIVLIILVIALVAYIIFGKVGPENGPLVDTHPMRDSISLLIKDRAELQRHIAGLNSSYDSLQNVRQKIKYIYSEK